MLVFTYYSTLQQLETHASEARYPNLAAKAAEVAGGNNQEAQELIRSLKNCLQPGISYFLQKFNVDFYS